MLRNPLAIPDLLLLPVTISHLARGKKIEEAKKNLSSGELRTMTSSTKRLVFYYPDHVKKGYPQTSSLSGVRRESPAFLRQEQEGHEWLPLRA